MYSKKLRSKHRGLFLANKNRSKVHSSKKVVQKFNGCFELDVLPQPLPQAAKDILGVLGAEGVAPKQLGLLALSKVMLLIGKTVLLSRAP